MGAIYLQGFLEDICSWQKQKVRNPAVKSLGKSRVEWGCQQVHVVGARSFLVGSLAEGTQGWNAGARRLGWLCGLGAGQNRDSPGMNWSGRRHSFSL